MSDDWGLLADTFVRGAYATVKGRVRTLVVHEQLRRHLVPPPAAVLDVGGGAGHQSFPLARLGYQVTLLDPSPAMLSEARGRLALESADVRHRVELVEARGEAAVEATGARRFAGVLAHGVVMYVADPAPLLAALCACTEPGGIVSVSASNARAMAVRPALERRFADARASFDATVEQGVLGRPTRADTVEALSAALEVHGATPEQWYGVWLFSDWLELAGVPASPEDLHDLAGLELEASRRDPYRQLSRLFHLVARKTR